jgi:hypothetical protein
MSRLNEETTSEELGEMALHIVKILDYDMWKEMKNEVEEGDYPSELEQIEDFLFSLVNI